MTLIRDEYREQVKLLIRLIPHVAKEKCFALKGGTAINLFVRDLPRLSVDIDLTYLPNEDWETSLLGIDAALKRVEQTIREALPEVRVNLSLNSQTKTAMKIVVRHFRTQVKIEVTPVLRGYVFQPELKTVSPAVEDEFGFAEMQVVSFADLYAGKLMAALDRQHPRDLFDVQDLLSNEGISDALREAFIVYLISHGKAFHDVLDPRRKDISSEYERSFVGMTKEVVPLEELLTTRETMIAGVVGEMPDNHQKLLLGILTGTPDWTLLPDPTIQNLPAVRRKLLELDKATKAKRTDMAKRLERIFTHIN